MSKLPGLCGAMLLFMLLSNCGAVATKNETCTMVANVLPASATADHSAARPGNMVQFVANSSVTGNCPLTPDRIGTWSTSDPANSTISNQPGGGLAVCLNATPTPATITYSGLLRGRVGFTPATLTCK